MTFGGAGVAVSDDGLYAYAVCRSPEFVGPWTDHFNAFDISDPTAPTLIGDLTLTPPEHPSRNLVNHVVVNGNRAYIIWRDKLNPANPDHLELIDISDPTSPFSVVQIELWQPTTRLSKPVISGGTTYIVLTDAGAIRSCSVDDTNITALDTDAGGANSTDTQRYGDYVLTCRTGASNNCYLWDVSNPVAISNVGTATYGTDGVDYFYTAGIRGTNLYVTYEHFDFGTPEFYSKVITFDITNPAAPNETGVHGTDSVDSDTNNVGPYWLACETAGYVYVGNVYSPSLQGLNAATPSALEYCTRIDHWVAPDYLNNGGLTGYSDLLLVWGDQYDATPSPIGPMLKLFRGL